MKIFKSFFTISLFILAGLCSVFVGFESNGQTPGTIEFIGDAGSPTKLTFERWKFTKTLIPDGIIEAIEVSLEINTSSLQSSWKELEKSLKKKKNYFYIKKFPVAIVKIKGAQKRDDGRYQTDALLTLKGVTKVVPLTFSIEGNHVIGEGVIMRREFNITGDGPKDEVPLSFDVYLPLTDSSLK
ncbi:MAG: YceI family protein [Bacteroidia bacterium]